MPEDEENTPKKERYKIPITVQLLMMNEDEKILLTKRKNTGYEDGKYCLPGGHVEPDEEIRTAMVREAKEEIGVDIKESDLDVYKIVNRKVEGGEYIDFILKPKKWEGEIRNVEKEKCSQLLWTNIEEMPENTLPFIQKILKEKNSIYIPYNWKEEQK